jgi:hypothetical protein
MNWKDFLALLTWKHRLIILAIACGLGLATHAILTRPARTPDGPLPQLASDGYLKEGYVICAIGQRDKAPIAVSLTPDEPEARAIVDMFKPDGGTR